MVVVLIKNMDDLKGQSIKKKKTPNFSASDRALLLKLGNEMRNIIESKKTDAVTWKQKEEGWKKIENKFNASTTGPHRTDKQLKNKYEAVKKELKKQHSQYSAYLRGTGGGPFVNPPPVRTIEEKVLASNVALCIEGLASEFDTDAQAGISGVSINSVIENISDSEKENLEVEVDWSNQNSDLLMTAKDDRLRALVEDTSGNIQIKNTENVILESQSEGEGISEHIYAKRTTPQGSTWQSRRRPVLKRKRCLTSTSAKFESLAENKLKLVQSQQRLIDDQIKFQRIEHEKKSLLLDLQIEEQRIKNQKIHRESVHSDTEH